MIIGCSLLQSLASNPVLHLRSPNAHVVAAALSTGGTKAVSMPRERGISATAQLSLSFGASAFAFQVRSALL